MPDTTTATTTTTAAAALDRPDDPTPASAPNPGDPRPTGARTSGPTETAAEAGTDTARTRRRRRPATTATTPATIAATSTEPGTSAVGGPAASAHDRVWAALRRHPATTAADLAGTSGVARSTVAKLLAAWSEDGSAISAAGATARPHGWWTCRPSNSTRPRPPRQQPRQQPGRRAWIHCLRWRRSRRADTRRGPRSGRARRRPCPHRRAPARNHHAGQHEPIGHEPVGQEPVGHRAAGRGSAAGDGPGLSQRSPRRARPDRDRPRVGTLLGCDRQCARAPRCRRVGRAHPGPTPALPQRRTSRHHRARDREHTTVGHCHRYRERLTDGHTGAGGAAHALPPTGRPPRMQHRRHPPRGGHPRG